MRPKSWEQVKDIAGDNRTQQRRIPGYVVCEDTNKGGYDAVFGDTSDRFGV